MLFTGKDKLTWFVESRKLKSSHIREDVEISVAITLEYDSSNGNYIPKLNQQPFLPLQDNGIVQADFLFLLHHGKTLIKIVNRTHYIFAIRVSSYAFDVGEWESGSKTSCDKCVVEKESILSELRNHAFISTNQGYKRLRLDDVPIHFSEEFGNLIDISTSKNEKILAGIRSHRFCENNEGATVTDYDSQELWRLLSHVSSKQ
ncbi:hypothetical protein Tco_0720207 [Tanacetum coccineum]